MQRPASPLPAGSYRLAPGVHVSVSPEYEGRASVLCDYPLRAIRVNASIARLLMLCREEQTCEQLAAELRLPLRRVEMLCDQLRWKGLLEVGPLLPPMDWPAVSIVIPSYNRAHDLERCIRALFQLAYPLGVLEIIVVDDASSDETQSVLRRLVTEAAQLGLSLRSLRHQQRQGVAMARNSGAAAACHELIAYIDSDCVASAEWLRELIPAFTDARVAAVGGLLRSYDRSRTLGCYEDVRSSLFFGTRAQQLRLEGPTTYLPTANFLLRKACWQQLGGFAALTHGEDVDFCRRLLLSGVQILYLPFGTVYHDYRTDLGAFLAIRIAYASSEAPLLRRGAIERRALILPPEQASFMGLALAALWSLLRMFGKRRRSSGYLAVGFTLAALVLTVGGTLARQRKLHRQRIAIALPAIFRATLRAHLAYIYQISKHLTRYYTLPMLIVSLFCPPFLPLVCILCAIVIGVDYMRLQPELHLFQYALYAFLDDCAYEIGVLKGCLKWRMWQPLVPIIKKRWNG